MQPKIPHIAIIGRPNVGKSSLFNAIIKKRKSITDELPGVTRDRIYETILLHERIPVCFVDTGGISKREKHDFIEEITQSARASLAEADLILFVIEAGNYTNDDEELTNYLRKHASNKTLLVVNKADNPNREAEAYDHAQLGFEDMVITSAAHTKGIESLIDSIVAFLERHQLVVEHDPEDTSDFEGKDLVRLSLFGRPNVGKSSFLNQVLGKERSIVSDIPGTTRDAIEEKFGFYGRKIKLIDTAGIRRKARVKEKLEYISFKRSLESIERSDIVLLLVDAVDGVTEQDKKLANLVLTRFKGLMVGVNKWDLMKGEVDEKAYLEKLRFQLRIAAFVPIIPLSVKDKWNIKKFMQEAVKIFDRFNQKQPTNTLTELFRDAVAQKPLFTKQGELKVFYASQQSTHPPHFTIVVNHKELLTEAYLRFFHNTLREKFNYSGIPLMIEIKNRKRSEK